MQRNGGGTGASSVGASGAGLFQSNQEDYDVSYKVIDLRR